MRYLVRSYIPVEFKEDLDEIVKDSEGTLQNISGIDFGRDAIDFLRFIFEDVKQGVKFFYEKKGEPLVAITMPGYNYQYEEVKKYQFQLALKPKSAQGLMELVDSYGHTEERVIRDALEIFIQHIKKSKQHYSLKQLKFREINDKEQLAFLEPVIFLSLSTYRYEIENIRYIS